MSERRGTSNFRRWNATKAGGRITPKPHHTEFPMIDLYYAPTPNGWKISIMLEELGIPYHVIPVNIRAGDQFKPEFLAISPNNRIPAIVDQEPPDGGGPFSVFETGAILIYLADKFGRFLPADLRARSVVIQWVMWQMSGLGPMLGQHGHFALYAPEKIPYAIQRWYADVRARPQVQAGLAVGKFVKEPFDEEARKNMFGQRAKEMTGKK